MNTYLIAISVGPVQSFIAAARRTRDLWFGSYLLSEICRVASIKLTKDSGCNLIYPHASIIEKNNKQYKSNCPNSILAEYCGEDPGELVANAYEAVQEKWDCITGNVFSKYKMFIVKEIWDNQKSDALEFYAAWSPFDPVSNASNPKSYRVTRGLVMRLLAGRKRCRDFLPAAGRAGVPKSSLDGLRESVLKKLDELDETALDRSELQCPLRIRPGEQLDVIGLVKRTAEGHRHYPSVSRVAADPWLRGAEQLRPDRFETFFQACQELAEAKPSPLHKLDVCKKSPTGQPSYSQFPFEGVVVYQARHHELLEENDHGIPSEHRSAIKDKVNRVGAELGKLIRDGELEEPNPYLAVLSADGDRMGKALSKLENPEDHRCFSQDLSKFAEEARRIVKCNRGVLIYSGGDDILAFVPVDYCLKCARELYEMFVSLLERRAERLEERLTLSVGVAIGHFLENMEDLLNYGRAAEKHAKRPRGDTVGGKQEERDGLAIHLHKRGGSPVEVRDQWSSQRGPDDREPLDRRIATLAEQLARGAIPNRIATDLHQISLVYDHWQGDSVKEAIRADALRVIAAKRPSGEQSEMGEIRRLVEARVEDANSLRAFADEILIARQFATVNRQVGPAAHREDADCVANLEKSS